MNKPNQILKFKFILFFLICFYNLNIFSEECKPTNKGFAVVELFTSEGCSSCPPAEKNINEFSKFESSKNIYPLAFHVTYWDYIGWKDPFGNSEFNYRQDEYTDHFKSRNYTPQAILNGKIDILGSDKTTLLKSIEKEISNFTKGGILMNSSRKGNVLEIQYKISCIEENSILNIALVEKGLTSVVKKGENQGRTLYHENVVRVFKKIIQNKNSGIVKLELNGLEKNPKNFEIIMYTQNQKTLEITSASSQKLN